MEVHKEKNMNRYNKVCIVILIICLAIRVWGFLFMGI